MKTQQEYSKPKEVTDLEIKYPELAKLARWFEYVSESDSYSFSETWKALWDYFKLAIKLSWREAREQANKQID